MRRKVKAGALTLVLAISIVVAAILGSLVMLVYYNRLSLLKTEIQQKLQANARSGLQLLLAMQQAKEGTTSMIDLFGDGDDTVFLSREPWGVYDALVSQARLGSHIEMSAALAGVQSQEELSLALYLCEEERPLSLSGKTLLKGDVRLPKAGVKTAYVDGISFVGGNLVEGEVMESSNSLPQLSPAFVSRIYFYCLRNFPEILQQIQYQNIDRNLQFSFAGEGGVIKSQQALTLANMSISGKAIIASEKEITIRKTAKLEDILITAPVIRVEKGFKGSLQLFATDSVIIEKGSRLSYPSAICLYSKGEGARIRVEEDSSVSGLIYLGGDGERLKDIVTIKRGATITGFVYADGFVQHEGAIQGGVYCRRLLYRTATSIYENYLVNATLDASALPSEFLGPALMGSSKRWEMVKWVK